MCSTQCKTHLMSVTRYIGNCQICEGDQKLHDGLMVHHGYRRPGTGYIVGDCPGVGEVPYEVSCELRKAYLAALQSGRVKTVWGSQGLRRVPQLVEYAVGVTEPQRFARAIEHAT